MSNPMPAEPLVTTTPPVVPAPPGPSAPSQPPTAQPVAADVPAELAARLAKLSGAGRKKRDQPRLPATPSADATATKILAAGVSVAAGIGLVGTMAVVANAQTAPVAVSQPARIVVISSPPAPAQTVSAPLGDPGRVSSASQSSVTQTAVPTAVVFETQAPAPTPEPVTTSEGS